MKSFVLALITMVIIAGCSKTSPKTIDQKSEEIPTAEIIYVIAGPGITSKGDITNNPTEFSFAHIEAYGYLGPVIRFYRSDDRKDWAGAILIQDPKNESEGSEELIFVKNIKSGSKNPTVMIEKICCKKARITLTFPSAEKMLTWNKSI